MQKIRFTHLLQYDENHCVYFARIGRHSKKADGNVTTHEHSIELFIFA